VGTVTGITDPWARSPIVAKRWLGLQMRRRRLAAGISPKDAATALRTVVAKIAYTENGTHAFKPRDLTEVLFPLYGVADEDQAALLAACRHSRDRGWWQAYDEEVLPDWARRYIGLEQGATTLRSWVALYPHGLVQTRGYAESLMRNDFAPRLEDDEIEARIELRLERQDALGRRPRPLEAHFIVDEAILHRVVGGPGVIGAQLDHLAEVAARPNVTIQVVPFAHGTHPEASGGFSILTFGDEDDPGVVYIEGRANGDYLDDPAEVEDHATVFEQLCLLALPPRESTALIGRLAKDHRR
jgi:hypothetical protein